MIVMDILDEQNPKHYHFDRRKYRELLKIKKAITNKIWKDLNHDDGNFCQVNQKRNQQKDFTSYLWTALLASFEPLISLARY